jgi:hypothetical protein
MRIAMSKRILAVTAAALLPFVVTESFAQDSAGPDCGTFETTIRFETGAGVDNGTDGPSPGDVRVLRYRIYGADDEPVGQMVVTATVMPQRDDGDYDLHSHLVQTFANGTVVSVEWPTLSEVLRPEVSPDQVIDGAVTGGTGAFAGVTGTTRAVPVENGVYKKTFALSCPN